MIKIKRPKQPIRPSVKGRQRRKKRNSFIYNEDFIVKELWAMQKQKCCYCEMHIPEEGHLKAVEHFRPKSIFRDLENNWDNLLLACSQCNGKKSDKFPLELTDNNGEAKVIYLRNDNKKRTLIKKGKSLLIDPSRDNPEDFFDFIFNDCEPELFGLIKTKGEDTRAEETLNVIDLRNKFYTMKHRTYLIQVLIPEQMRLIDAYSSGNVTFLDSCKRQFSLLMDSSHEFAGLTRAFVKSKKIDEKYEISIPA